MPVSDYGASFKQHQSRGPDPDKDNRSHHDHERHYRVHNDAERAMIGVAADRMHVRHLSHGQKRQ